MKVWPFLLFSSLLWGQNQIISDYKSALRILNEEFGNSGKTFFCQCDYFRRDINLKSCGFSFEKYFERQRRVEWVPVVSPEIFAKSFSSYKGHEDCKRVKSIPTRSSMRSMGFSTSYYNYTTTPKPFDGIECVRKVDRLFNKMEGDLYNLVPENGAVNVLKGSSRLADIHILIPQFGACNLKIINNFFSPPSSVSGDVARIFLYMNWAYPGKIELTSEEKKLIDYWNKVDPVSSDECQRASKVQKIQGNANPFVQKFCH